MRVTKINMEVRILRHGVQMLVLPQSVTGGDLSSLSLFSQVTAWI